MSPLPAPRRTIAETAPDRDAIPQALASLMASERDLEMSSVRITGMLTGEFTVTGQVGEMAGTRCPRCNGYWHTADGACIDSPRQVRSTPAADEHRAQARSLVAAARVTTATECSSCHALPNQPHTDYCQRENRDYPGQPGVRTDPVAALDATAQARLDTIATEPAFVDDGCRCPTRTPHTPGCPVLPHPYIEAADLVDSDEPSASEPYCWTCGAGLLDPRHAVGQ